MRKKGRVRGGREKEERGKENGRIKRKRREADRPVKGGKEKERKNSQRQKVCKKRR